MVCKKTVQQIWQIQLKTKKMLSGTMIGNHHSANKGAGFEFDQVREYQPGDDVRFIDWKSSARSGKILTKQYFEERNQDIMLALDVSSSSFVDGALGSKYNFMAELAVIFATVAQYSKEGVGLTLFSDKINLELPISRGQSHAFKLAQLAFSFKPSQATTNIDFALKHLSKKLRKKTLVILISDLIDTRSYQRSLKLLQHRHEVVVLRCLDKCEQRLPNVGILPVVDPETGECAMLDTRVCGAPNQALLKRIKDQDLVFKNCGVDVLEIKDRLHTVSEIVKFFRRRLAS